MRPADSKNSQEIIYNIHNTQHKKTEIIMAKYARKKRSAIALQSVEQMNYSVAMRKNPMNENDPKKAYANVQYEGTIQLEQLAEHIKSHGSPYTRDMIVGIATALVDCTREYLTRGFKVALGDLGTFRISIAQRAAKTKKAFTANNITDAWAEYEPGGYFVDLRDEINFTEVPTRLVQNVAAKLVKEGTITQEQWQAIMDGEATIEIDEGGNVTPVTPEP